MTAVLLLARAVLAAVFALAAAAKLADRDGGRTALLEFGVPAGLVAPLTLALPAAEVALAGLLLPAATAPYAALASIALLALFTAVLARALRAGRAPACRCFGALSRGPTGRGAIVRNCLLAALAAAICADGLLAGGAPSFAVASPPATLLLALAGGSTVALAAAWLGFELLRQHGRLLERIDRLERIAGGPARATAVPGAADAAALRPPASAPLEGLALADLDGAPVPLASLVGDRRPLLLVFSDPACGPCRTLLPEVAAWQRDHADATVVVVSRAATSEAVAHAEGHGVARLLLDPGDTVADALGVAGTPSAVLVDATGLAHPAVAGLDAVRALAAELLRVGAPPIDLPGLDGRIRSADLAGRETLVVFWNPACGYCERMRDDLLALDRRAAAGEGPGLLVVSTGDAAANRALGLAAPVALDDGFAAGHAFGAAGTPAAVLLAPDGTIGSKVAVGGDALLALAGAAPR